jgi:hypothetical protein
MQVSSNVGLGMRHGALKCLPALDLQLDSLSSVSEGFVGDLWLSTSTLCHIPHYFGGGGVLQVHTFTTERYSPHIMPVTGLC